MLKGKEVAGSAPRLPASAKGKEIIGSSTISRRHNTTKNIGSLQDLPAGSMGKMLVYKSGTVKLKLGDILYNVSTSFPCLRQKLSNCTFDERYEQEALSKFDISSSSQFKDITLPKWLKY